MLKSSHVTQQDIATRAGVHITTVSLALRDSLRLPSATRQRIQGLAAEMGYRPDPMLSALTVYRERLKRVRHQGVIAWMSPVVKKGMAGPDNQEYRRGAEERCVEAGYKLEDFCLSDFGRTRLSKILHTRNIEGLLIPPQSFNRAHINFDWERFSAVCFGFTLARPKLHLITNAQYQSSRIAVRGLRRHGYRRIGFVISGISDERTDQNFSSGFLSEQRRFRAAEQIPLLVITAHTAHEERASLESWYRQHRPEAILALHPPVEQYMQQLGIDYDECGYASLSLPNTDGNVAGIYQNYRLIGRAAVSFLINMMHNNDRGIPKERFNILIDGSWVEGKTIRTKSPEASANADREPRRSITRPGNSL